LWRKISRSPRISSSTGGDSHLPLSGRDSVRRGQCCAAADGPGGKV
jgi:hypothetical protein